jgi:hypothetical protein
MGNLFIIGPPRSGKTAYKGLFSSPPVDRSSNGDGTLPGVSATAEGSHAGHGLLSVMIEATSAVLRAARPAEMANGNDARAPAHWVHDRRLRRRREKPPRATRANEVGSGVTVIPMLACE